MTTEKLRRDAVYVPNRKEFSHSLNEVFIIFRGCFHQRVICAWITSFSQFSPENNLAFLPSLLPSWSLSRKNAAFQAWAAHHIGGDAFLFFWESRVVVTPFISPYRAHQPTTHYFLLQEREAGSHSSGGRPCLPLPGVSFLSFFHSRTYRELWDRIITLGGLQREKTGRIFSPAFSLHMKDIDIATATTTPSFSFSSFHFPLRPGVSFPSFFDNKQAH